jgi:TPR repeat protein
MLSGPGMASPDALFQLGLRYSLGREVSPDPVSAHKWFNLAALKGSQSAKEYRAEMAREMSSRQIAEAQKQAREWLRGH